MLRMPGIGCVCLQLGLNIHLAVGSPSLIGGNGLSFFALPSFEGGATNGGWKRLNKQL